VLFELDEAIDVVGERTCEEVQKLTGSLRGVPSANFPFLWLVGEAARSDVQRTRHIEIMPRYKLERLLDSAF
jgi:hypothetical protein